jgi:hypothetical protein
MYVLATCGIGGSTLIEVKLQVTSTSNAGKGLELLFL